MIQGVIVGKTECADEARGQKEAVYGRGGTLDQSQSECDPRLCPTRMVEAKGSASTARS